MRDLLRAIKFVISDREIRNVAVFLGERRHPRALQLRTFSNLVIHSVDEDRKACSD